MIEHLVKRKGEHRMRLLLPSPLRTGDRFATEDQVFQVERATQELEQCGTVFMLKRVVLDVVYP